MYDKPDNMPVLPEDYESDVPLDRFSQDHFINVNGGKLLDFCKLNSLRICNGGLGQDKGIGKYTYIGGTGSSVVDYVLVSESIFNFISKFSIGDPNILSDHCEVTFSISDVRFEAQPSEETMQMGEQICKKIWNSEKSQTYQNSIDSYEEEFSILQLGLNKASSECDINENIGQFSKLMDKICDPIFAKNIQNDDGIIHTSNNCAKNQPWFDEDCSAKRQLFYNELENFRKNNTTCNQRKLTEARRNFKNEIRRKRYLFDRSKTEKLIVSKSKNVKEYWRLLKKAANVENKNTISASRFSEYFQAINNPTDHFFQADEDIIHFNERYINGEYQIMFEELNGAITYLEMKKAVKQLRNGASAGPDLFLNEFFKNGNDTLMKYIYTLLNKLFELGYFPKSWSNGFIVPIYKKGDKNEPSNYRGITLLSTLGKLFTRILNNRLNEWAENYNVYIEAQAGFRKNMGTVDNIYISNGLITHVLKQNKKLYCAFVDFTKAFDFVNRDILWYKLIKIGVRGKMLDIIRSMYKEVKSQVKHNNIISPVILSNKGVRQGECLSPFLFSIYLNDLEEEISLKGSDGIDIGMVKLFLAHLSRRFIGELIVYQWSGVRCPSVFRSQCSNIFFSETTWPIKAKFYVCSLLG